MEYKEKTLSRDVKYEGRVVRVYRDEVELPTGDISHREVVMHNGGVCIIAVMPDGRIIMERQYRYALQKSLFELPAGKLEPNEKSKEAGIRELKEETGATAANFDYLGEMYPTPGYDNEVIYFYTATDLTFGATHFDLGEYIELEYKSLKELMEMIKNGEIHDAKTVYGLTLFALKTGKISLLD